MDSTPTADRDIRPRPWRRISSRVRFANPWWKYLLDRVELPGGDEGEYHIVETPGSVIVVPVDDEGRLLLVRQYRYPNDRCSLEFPGGGITREGGALDSAARELKEEAGVSAGTLIPLGRFNPWNGVTSEICSVFLALDLRPCDRPHDPAEECITERHAVEDFERLAVKGDIWDGQTLAAWTLFRLRGER